MSMYRQRQRKVYIVLILQCKRVRNTSVFRFEQIRFNCSRSEKGLSNHHFRSEAHMGSRSETRNTLRIESFLISSAFALHPNPTHTYSQFTAILDLLTNPIALHSTPQECFVILQPKFGPIVCQLVVTPITHPR